MDISLSARSFEDVVEAFKREMDVNDDVPDVDDRDARSTSTKEPAEMLTPMRAPATSGGGQSFRDQCESSVKDSEKRVNELVRKYNGVKRTNTGDQTSDFKISKLYHLLKEMIEITKEPSRIRVAFLKKSKIGTYVAKLREREDSLGSMSNDLIRRWRKIVQKKRTKKRKMKDPAAATAGVEESAKKVPRIRLIVRSPGSSQRAKAPESPKDNTSSVLPVLNSLPKIRRTFREKLRRNMRVAVKKVSTVDSAAVDAQKIAARVEELLFGMHGRNERSAVYVSRCRALCSALKRNGALAVRLGTGEIAPSDFSKMHGDALLSEEQRLARKKEEDHYYAAIDQSVDTSGLNGTHKCGRCRTNKTTFTQRQTRCADEPMTTFVTCHNCGNRWRY